MGYEFEFEGQRIGVLPIYHRRGFDLEIEGRRISATLTLLSETSYHLDVDGRVYPIQLAKDGDEIFIHLDGRSWRVVVVDSLERASLGAEGSSHSSSIAAPMPGTVVAITRRVGDPVEEGETILTIESMKLQTAIKAPRDGVVVEVNFEEGAMFPKGAILVRFEEGGTP